MLRDLNADQCISLRLKPRRRMVEMYREREKGTLGEAWLVGVEEKGG
jgi:hypothetical protein